MNRRKLIGELLSILERKESRLLGWGFLDVSFSSDEIVETFREADSTLVVALEEWLETTSTELFVDNLAEANLIARTEGGRYRSRFAETLRLLGRLRQRFSNDDWSSAPNLVSDLKIHLVARKYPKRNISAIDAWEQIEQFSWSIPIQKFAFETLTNVGNKALDFAGFQIRGTQRILSHYQPSNHPSGTVISAGTGAGKTKAFYLPAFMGIASDIEQDDRDFTKVLAIYPRNVLLADQFTEAVSQAILLHKKGTLLSRPITFGAYLGDTPYTSVLRSGQFALKNWKRYRLGWIPPFIKHPINGSELIWTDADRLAGRTALRSVEDQEKIIIPDGMVYLTRDHIRKCPPDVLMMSLEMLNKEMSSPGNAAMLGFKSNLPSPRLVLLDEVHTYAGISGAQVPWILRRWSYWVKRWRSTDSNPHFVGLSATLKEASLHLSALAGISEANVEEIKPENSLDEIESEGIEYNVAIKSHAGSGASGLATSIQTVMLGARTLTPPTVGICDQNSDDLAPQCFWGRKVFGFTDNLDSLNRWMADFVNADGQRRLAKFRSSVGVADILPRMLDGQVWKLSEDLGYDLNQSLATSRCSSQDPGVDSRSNVVLATSSLEVGYDDPNVGMMVHHKSPRSAASFLQRKGRVGRQRGIRPWTLVVLSDFGRDRWAFKDSERLFHPELDPLKIPALNPYVVRVQATQFLIDWIGNKIGTGEPYRYLSSPDEFRQPKIKKLLNSLATNETARDEFVRDLMYWLKGGSVGLRLSDPDMLADSILWNPPRSVLRHAIPELAKVIAGDFKPLGAQKPLKLKRPLPRFIPAATFGELDAQDVEIRFDDGSDSEIVDIAVALREAPPCRVSRRYAVKVRQKSLWHECSKSIFENELTSIDLNTLFPDSYSIGSDTGIEISQPLAIQLVSVPSNVKDSSSGSFNWQFTANFVGSKDRLGLVGGPVLSRVFSSCEGYFHRRYAHAVVSRFSSKMKYEVVLDKGIKKRGMVNFVSEGDGATDQAIGYRRLVDALKFKIDFDHLKAIPILDELTLQRLRPLYFRYKLSNSAVLINEASSFGIGSLWNSSVSMLAATALIHNTTLEDASTKIGDRSGAARKVFECMLLGEVAADLTGDSDGASTSNRRIREVQDLWQNADVKDEVCRLEATLWNTQDEEFDQWLLQIYLDTLSNSLEQAIWAVVPEIPEGDLAIDIVASDNGFELVVSEVAAGGVGHLERLVVEVGNGPELFDAAFEAAIKSCENDRLTSQLLTSVERAKDNTSNIFSAFEMVRSSSSFHELDSAKDSLIDGLTEGSLASDRSFVSTLVSKVLRPGSSRVTDLWVRTLSRRREKLSAKIGISLDPRVFAYWCVQTPTLNRRMVNYLRNIGKQEPTPDQVFSAFVQHTFHGCSDSCPECLGVRNEMEGIHPSRSLAWKWIDLDSIDCFIDAEQCVEWKKELKESLRMSRRIKVAFSDEQRVEIAKYLSCLLAEEHDRGYIFSPFTTTSLSRTVFRWEIILHPSGELAC